ncbi:unnamed protein product [Enterobius vermicularis]|uniref:Paired domain-containing protein n=1 Tax=Enterobius vermicularis TaxID=51028 RepID=A0A0N4VIC1_ENTVE|nr:unnamed protein product [Enterobius vermicularis]
MQVHQLKGICTKNKCSKKYCRLKYSKKLALIRSVNCAGLHGRSQEMALTLDGTIAKPYPVYPTVISKCETPTELMTQFYFTVELLLRPYRYLPFTCKIHIPKTGARESFFLKLQFMQLHYNSRVSMTIFKQNRGANEIAYLVQQIIVTALWNSSFISMSQQFLSLKKSFEEPTKIEIMPYCNLPSQSCFVPYPPTTQPATVRQNSQTSNESYAKEQLHTLSRSHSSPNISSTKNKLGRMYNPGRPLAMADRQKILHLYEKGHKISHIARIIGVTHSCVSKIMTRYRRTGSMHPRSTNNGRQRLSDTYLSLLDSEAERKLSCGTENPSSCLVGGEYSVRKLKIVRRRDLYQATSVLIS